MVCQGYWIHVCLDRLTGEYRYYLSRDGKRGPVSKASFDGTIKAYVQARKDIVAFGSRLLARMTMPDDSWYPIPS